MMLAVAAAAAAERLEFDAGVHASTPSLAVDPARGLVLTWQTRNGDTATLNYALLADDGRELRRGVVASGKDWFVNWADFPSLAVLDNGDWVSHWLQKTAPDTYAYDVRVLRSRDGGLHWGAALTPHADGTPTEHGFASLLALGGDRVQLLWLDGRHSGGAASGHADEGPMTLRGATLDRRGRIGDRRELDALTCSCCQTDAVRIGERALVVYRDRSEGEVRDIALVERDSGGAWSQPEIVHADGWRVTACPVNGPAIAANGALALIAWPTLAQPPMSVRYRLRDAAGYAPMRELEHGETVLGRVDAGAAANGGFAISWIGAGADGAALKLATISAGGELRSVREVAPLEPGRSTGHPRLAWYRGAHFLAWTESLGGGRTRIALARLAGD